MSDISSGASPYMIARYDPSPWKDLKDEDPQNAVAGMDAETGWALWLHWCPPLNRTVVLPNYNYCPECGSKLEQEAPDSHVCNGLRLRRMSIRHEHGGYTLYEDDVTQRLKGLNYCPFCSMKFTLTQEAK